MFIGNITLVPKRLNLCIFFKGNTSTAGEQSHPVKEVCIEQE